MARVVVSSAAHADVNRIIDYLEKHAGRRVALRYAIDFDATFARLVEFPAIGSPRPLLGPELRMLIIDPYLVFYDLVSATEVRVLRVLHGRRNITAGLISRP